jgi:outer membrane murein-binding lipoprotein Lpp
MGVAMIRRSQGALSALSAVVLGTCLALAGCDSLHHGVRQKDKDESAAEAKKEPDGSEVYDVQSKTKQPFFKPSRLPGAMSDEGRDIENDLGIH